MLLFVYILCLYRHHTSKRSQTYDPSPTYVGQGHDTQTYMSNTVVRVAVDAHRHLSYYVGVYKRYFSGIKRICPTKLHQCAFGERRRGHSIMSSLVIDLTGEDDERDARQQHKKQRTRSSTDRETPRDLKESSRRLLPFQLLKTRGIPWDYQQGPLGFDLVRHVAGEIQVAFISNYMIDIPWLVDTFPDLFFSDKVILVHGQQGASDGMRRQLKMLGVEDATVCCPWVPPYGTHHTKAFFLQYKRGIRIIIHTANLLYCDVNNKSQSVFMQDFPLKSDESNDFECDFEHQLLQYVERLELGDGLEREMKDIISMHDYRYARGRLVSSVPSKPWEFRKDAVQYGQARMASILGEEEFDSKYADAPIVAQFSSVGNISEKFMKEITQNFSSGQYSGLGSTRDTRPVAIHLVWPTVAEVRDSLEGWFGGGSVCGYPNRLLKTVITERIHRWGGNVTGRQRALPHMKTYLRYNRDDQTIPWILLTSHNFSKAAWGEFVQSKKYNSKLFRILSYEMGILLLPRLELAYRNSPHYGFSCTGTSTDILKDSITKVDCVEYVPWKKDSIENECIVSDEKQPSKKILRVPITLPFELPPVPYPSDGCSSYEATPWTITPPDTLEETIWNGVDALGNSYPGKGSYQGVLQRDTDENLWYHLFSNSQGSA